VLQWEGKKLYLQVYCTHSFKHENQSFDWTFFSSKIITLLEGLAYGHWLLTTAKYQYIIETTKKKYQTSLKKKKYQTQCSLLFYG